jgi:hypothetical protein
MEMGIIGDILVEILKSADFTFSLERKDHERFKKKSEHENSK